MLVDFASVVDAVACGVTIQRKMRERNSDVPEDKRIVFRLGINIGDIIIEGNDIFGDGVNIAARLETSCEPGGLCISDIARDQVRDKLPLTFADYGEQQVKNIARPVRVFGLSPQAIAEAPDLAQGRAGAGGRAAPRCWRPALASSWLLPAAAPGGRIHQSTVANSSIVQHGCAAFDRGAAARLASRKARKITSPTA